VADTLLDISSVLVSDLDLERVLTDILDGLSRVVTLDSAAILLVDDEAEVLTVVATKGAQELTDIAGREIPLDELDLSAATDLEEAVSGVFHDLQGLVEEHSHLIVPLTTSGELIGYLVVDHLRPGYYRQDEASIVRAFANQAAIAINNARLFTAQQAESWVTMALLQVAEAVSAQVDVAEVLETIAHLTTLLAGVSQCIILRWDPSDQCYHLGARYGTPPGDGEPSALEPLSPMEHALLDLLTVAEQPIGAGEGHQLPMPEAFAPLLAGASLLAFPLRAKQESVGALIVDDPRRGRPLDPRLFNILTGIAHQTATALETATLEARAAERDRLEQELHVARTIQASFIPESPPPNPGWQMAAHWRAARQVSGDFYDFIALHDGLWGLAIADVADKGIPAALFMVMCRTLLRAAAISRTSPAATLLRLNQLLFNDSRSDLFVTVFYAVWDPVTGGVVYANAGHNPPLLVRGGDSPRITELRSKGIALSVLRDAKIEEHQLTLKPGDLILAYTDGLTEAMKSDNEEWGVERLKEVVGKLHQLPAPRIVRGILDSVDQFVGDAPQSDDLTLWLVQREPE
jgi:serine phosphatase RsbU (regulator of sigma subunit)